MSTLEQKFFIVQCFFRNGERFENGEWSYSTPLFLRNFNKSFRTFNTLTNFTYFTHQSFGTVQLILKKYLHFFPYRVSVVHENKPLDNKSPHNITSLNIDRWIDL
jgi:hypothetical protein